MRLITNCGRRVDRQAELAALIHTARITPYDRVTTKQRQRVKLLLDLDHQEREQIRYGHSPLLIMIEDDDHDEE